LRHRKGKLSVTPDNIEKCEYINRIKIKQYNVNNYYVCTRIASKKKRTLKLANREKKNDENKPKGDYKNRKQNLSEYCVRHMFDILKTNKYNLEAIYCIQTYS